jgi:Asp/Glu/hydantoin racemase
LRTLKEDRGYSFYGYPIGILVMDTTFVRIPGDIGNALTWDFPVYYKVVRGTTFERVVVKGDPRLIQPFVKAAKELEEIGVKAITTSCGFLSLFQQELANALSIPVFTSSLLQIPLISRMLGKGKKVGIITAHRPSLTRKHLKAMGAEGIPHVIAGMEGKREFCRMMSEASYDPLEIEKESVLVARKFVRKHPEVGAIVLECANMPPYGKAIQQALSLPVFDIVTLTELVHSALVKREFLARK